DRRARRRRRAADHRCAGRAGAGPRLYRPHLLHRGDGGARQHYRHAGRGADSRRRRIDRAHDVRRVLGAGDFVCDAARGARDPAARIIRPMTTKASSAAFWIGAVAFLAAVLVMTQVVRNEYPFFAGYVILQFIVLSTAWSILGGSAGYVNFGTNAFFGVGIYSAVFLTKAFGAPLVVQILAAAAVGALLGGGVGLLTLRMRGIFFSIATIALAIIIETLVINWRYVGGAAGIQLQAPPVMAPFDTYVKLLFT